MVSRFQVHLAAHHVRSGGVIAYPTQGVWGLGCDPFNRRAVFDLLRLKKRCVDKGLILIASDIEMFEDYLYAISEQQKQRLMSAWSRPNIRMTYIVPDPEHRQPSYIRGCFSSVALRVTSHPAARLLCEKMAQPIVSTSANIHGMPTALNALDVRRYFKQQVDYILPGTLGHAGASSSICDLESEKIIRR